MNYHPGAISLFKTMPSSRYNAAERTWSFALKDHNELARVLRPLHPEVQLDPLPRWVLATFGTIDVKSSKVPGSHNSNDKNVSINHDPDGPNVEPCLWDNLMPLQKDGVRYA